MADREKLEAKAREVGQLIGAAMPPGYGFALFIFGFGGWARRPGKDA